MTSNTISYDWEQVTFSEDSLLHCAEGLVYYHPGVAYDLKAGIKLDGPVVVASGSVLSFRGPGRIVYEAYNDVNSPSIFVGGTDFTIADSATANKMTITIASLPNAGGFTVTSIEWSMDGGSTWAALTRKTAGTEDVTTGTGSKTLFLRLNTVQGVSAKGTSQTATVS